MSIETAWLEGPLSRTAQNWLLTRYKSISSNYMDHLLRSELYHDLNTALSAHGLESSENTRLKFLLAGKLKVLTDAPLAEAETLLVEVDFEDGQEEPFQAIAVVAGHEDQTVEGFQVAALKFVGLSKETVLGMREVDGAALPHYMAWA